MTFIVTFIIGAGVLLIASAVDGCSIVTTFQKIVSGTSIDWTGNTPCPSTTAPSATNPSTTPATTPTATPATSTGVRRRGTIL